MLATLAQIWTPSLLVAVAALGLMGFAAQRGGTCTVAAIEEVVIELRFGRLAALVEASLWVGGGLILLSAARLIRTVPLSYPVGPATIAGGALLGLGAFVNRSCALGTIARLGAGHWSYLATPVGFFFGALAVARLSIPEQSSLKSTTLDAPAWLALLCVTLIVLRLFTHGRTVWRRRIAPLAHSWSSHVATTVIALTFLIAYTTVGPWTYTSTIADLSRGEMGALFPGLLLFGALFVGTMLGAWTDGRVRFVAPAAANVCRRLAGGALMGAGATLVPGGNDVLLLVGMPLLLPYAWFAFATMCVTIYLAIRLSHAISRTSDTANPGSPVV